MKKISLLFLILIPFFSLSCANRVPVNPINITNTSNVSYRSCKKYPKVWWGSKGEDPSKNTLWKCSDWILKAR